MNLFSSPKNLWSESRYGTKQNNKSLYVPINQRSPSHSVERVVKHAKYQRENLALRARLELNLSLNKKLKFGHMIQNSVAFPNSHIDRRQSDISESSKTPFIQIIEHDAIAPSHEDAQGHLSTGPAFSKYFDRIMSKKGSDYAPDLFPKPPSNLLEGIKLKKFDRDEQALEDGFKDHISSIMAEESKKRRNAKQFALKKVVY